MARQSLHRLKFPQALLAGAFALAAPVAVLAQTGAAGTQNAPAALIRFDIPAQPLSQALMALARQAGIDLYAGSADLAGLQAGPLIGQFTVVQGLDVLLAGTGIAYRQQPTQGGARPSVQLLPRPPGAAARAVPALPGMLVTGSLPQEKWVYEAPRAVSVITREQIDRTPPRHAADMIEATPGVASAVNRLNPGLSVNIRGMQDFGRVNMMIDGMRQNFVQTGHMQRNGEMYVDSELLSGVVIERGPRNTAQGTGAIAGTINFRTLDYDDIIMDGKNLGFRLRGTTGLGNAGNGVNFLGSAAAAARVGEIEVLAAYSRRSFGDYEIGKRGASHNVAWQDGALAAFNDVKFASQRQNSDLFKARWNLAPGHSLQLSHIGTRVDYQNTTDANNSLQAGGTVWRSIGHSRATSAGTTLDWNFAPPGNDLVDMRLKLYTVDTENRNYANASYPGVIFGSVRDPAVIRDFIDGVWARGECEREQIPTASQASCEYGMGSDTRIRTRTHGLQFDNTSRFALGETAMLSANYGVEYFTDRAHSSVTMDHNGRNIERYNPYGFGESLNPRGRRNMGSMFANLTYEDERYTLSAGLRYEKYWLRGATQVPGTQHIYQTRYDRFLAYHCSRNQPSSADACRAGREGGEAGARAWQAASGDSRDYDSNRLYSPQWAQDSGLYEYDVDRSEGRLLPSLSAAVRPTSWLELFANWGKSWRPPAITESLMVGGHPGDNSSFMYPNPFADPERTTSWEIGANTIFNDVLTSGDMLTAKLSYFDTRAQDYLFSSMNNNTPGTGTNSLFGLGKTVFVNNRNTTRFRGLELESQYDAGWFYAGASYTHYIGGPNEFCQDMYFAGAGTSRHDQPDANGNYPQAHLDAVAQGYPSWQAWADDQVVCVNTVMNSAIAKPVDKAAVLMGVRLLERRLDTGVRFSYSGSGWYNRDTGGAQTWFAYTTWDWYASFQATKNVKLMAAVENITDRMYRDGYSDALARTYAPGRTMQVGMELRF